MKGACLVRVEQRRFPLVGDDCSDDDDKYCDESQNGNYRSNHDVDRIELFGVALIVAALSNTDE